ncbi:MAG: fasciclin domain-containing protein [Bacteroidetes bacterium]|nr:fasciclin domain-containing protein [Fibrella sp.]
MIAADGRFTTLTRMLTAAGMIDTLSGSGPFTLFAPTDAAFGRLPDGFVAGLLRPETKMGLTNLLTRHAVAGKTMRGELSDGQVLQTINGQPLSVSITEGAVRVNGVPVIDLIEAANGCIYALDAVLLPDSAN